MEKLKTTLIAAIVLATVLMLAPMSVVKAEETPIWSEWVYSATGAPVTSPVLESGKLYRIEASEIFLYNQAGSLAADAMYYTTDASNYWDWANHFPAPEGHAFLQINGADVNWGPFSNGDTGHTYTIPYMGTGEAITFQIIDWIDGYTNNYCHLPVAIYAVDGEGFTPGYWKNHIAAWAQTGYSTSQTLNTVFGDDAPSGTLLQALRFKGGRGLDGAKQILARAATAALLNTATFGANYPYTAAQLTYLVSYQFSYGTRASILDLATELDNYNNL